MVSHSVPLTPVKYNPYCGKVPLDSYTILNGEVIVKIGILTVSNNCCTNQREHENINNQK